MSYKINCELINQSGAAATVNQRKAQHLVFKSAPSFIVNDKDVFLIDLVNCPYS